MQRAIPMRKLLVLLHRWFGLGLTLFLFQAGLTGALIAWDHELDALLNPSLYRAELAPGAEALPPLRLAEIVEAADPRLQVTFTPLAIEPGSAVMMSVAPRLDPTTGAPHELGFDQIAVHPASGEIQARRQWGALSLSREQLMPFLYRLHYSLHLPAASGVELGMWLLGIAAIVWVVDTLIALWISFPNLRAWRKSFAFRFDKGGYRLTFDLHRSGGVWAWLLLLPLAVTAVSMNLGSEVVRPVVSWFSPLAESPFETRVPSLEGVPAALPRERAIALAEAEAARLGITAPLGGIFYSVPYGVYGVGFHAPGDGHGDIGLGNPWLYFDGQSGAPAGAALPGTGSAGDLFMQLQFPLHSGRILGTAGRVGITALGLMVSMLSVTGLVIWAKKRKQRLLERARQARGAPPVRAPVGARPELTT